MLEQKPTIKDVAKAANVSIATVSRALNGTAVVSTDTLERIEQAVHLLHYVPNTAAKQLAGRERLTLGFAIPHMRGDFFLPLLEGVERGAHEAGYGLLIHTVPQTSSASRPSLNPVNEHSTDGLIIFPGSLSPTELTRLSALKFPLVSLYQAAEGYPEAPVVTFENRRSAYQLVRHLIEVHGRKRIAFLRGPGQQKDSLEREAGYCDALAEAGLTPLTGQGDYHEQCAFATVRDWLEADIPFDAIFSGSDEAAVGALAALRQAEIPLPQQVAVVGFDDLRLARHMSPPLTTVRLPIGDGGYLAAKTLVALIRKEVVTDTVLPTDLVIRTSCGCSCTP